MNYLHRGSSSLIDSCPDVPHAPRPFLDNAIVVSLIRNTETSNIYAPVSVHHTAVALNMSALEPVLEGGGRGRNFTRLPDRI